MPIISVVAIRPRLPSRQPVQLDVPNSKANANEAVPAVRAKQECYPGVRKRVKVDTGVHRCWQAGPICSAQLPGRLPAGEAIVACRQG